MRRIEPDNYIASDKRSAWLEYTKTVSVLLGKNQ